MSDNLDGQEFKQSKWSLVSKDPFTIALEKIDLSHPGIWQANEQHAFMQRLAFILSKWLERQREFIQVSLEATTDCPWFFVRLLSCPDSNFPTVVKNRMASLG